MTTDTAAPTVTYVLTISRDGYAAPLRKWRRRCADLTDGQSYVAALLEDLAEDIPPEQHTEDADAVNAIRAALGPFVTVTEVPYDDSPPF